MISYTTQSAYEAIKRYFSKSGAVIATDPGTGSCAYRAIVGDVVRKCAVGCLIPDELYTTSIEEDGWEGSKRTLINVFGAERVDAVFGDVDDAFLLDAQLAHDDQPGHKNGVRNFLDRLDQLAKEYGLKVATP